MHLRDIFKAKDNKTMINLLAAFVVGVVLLISSNTLFTGKEIKPAAAQPEIEAPVTLGYEEYLENRLSKILSDVEGAGKVKAMVTLTEGKELIVAEDGSYEKSVTKETDAAGGSREVESLNTSGTKIMLRGDGGKSTPLILKEVQPKIEGVIIVAEGGGNAGVKEQLIKATQTVLGVESHKVQVLKLKTLK